MTAGNWAEWPAAKLWSAVLELCQCSKSSCYHASGHGLLLSLLRPAFDWDYSVGYLQPRVGAHIPMPKNLLDKGFHLIAEAPGPIQLPAAAGYYDEYFSVVSQVAFSHPKPDLNAAVAACSNASFYVTTCFAYSFTYLAMIHFSNTSSLNVLYRLCSTIPMRLNREACQGTVTWSINALEHQPTLLSTWGYKMATR